MDDRPIPIDAKDSLTSQLEHTIMVLRTLDDHKQRMAWSAAIGFVAFTALATRLDTSGSSIILIQVITSIALITIYLTLSQYVSKQIAIANEANAIIRACRDILAKNRFSLELLSADLLAPGERPAKGYNELPPSHPQWYPNIVNNLVKREYLSVTAEAKSLKVFPAFFSSVADFFNDVFCTQPADQAHANVAHTKTWSIGRDSVAQQLARSQQMLMFQALIVSLGLANVTWISSILRTIFP
ncbi:MAG: hypothetical protein AAFR96_06625 [Planctomycetota bacterium]